MFWIRIEHRPRQTLGFATEDKNICWGVGCLGVGHGRSLGEIPGLRCGEPIAQRWPVIHDFALQVLPVVQAGSSQIPVVHPESQRTYHPQLGTDGDAGAPDVAGILWDLRLKQNDV